MIDRSRIWSENIKLIENGRYWDKRTERKNKKRMKTPNWNSASYFSFDQCSLFLASLLALRTQKSHPHSNRYNTVYNISGEEESSQENTNTVFKTYDSLHCAERSCCFKDRNGCPVTPASNLRYIYTSLSHDVRATPWRHMAYDIWQATNFVSLFLIFKYREPTSLQVLFWYLTCKFPSNTASIT